MLKFGIKFILIIISLLLIYLYIFGGYKTINPPSRFQEKFFKCIINKNFSSKDLALSATTHGTKGFDVGYADYATLMVSSTRKMTFKEYTILLKSLLENSNLIKMDHYSIKQEPSKYDSISKNFDHLEVNGWKTTALWLFNVNKNVHKPQVDSGGKCDYLLSGMDIYSKEKIDWNNYKFYPTSIIRCSNREREKYRSVSTTQYLGSYPEIEGIFSSPFKDSELYIIKRKDLRSISCSEFF